MAGENEGDRPAGYSAFISHASEDGETAEAICAQLEHAGFRCFVAPRDLRPGKDYGDEIIRGIEQSKCLVLVLSAKANASAFVRAEVERAYSKGKPVFPIRIEEVLPSRALELFVSTQHWIDAWKGSLAQHTEKLALALAHDADLDVGLPPELWRRVRMRRFLRIGLGAVGTAAIAVTVALIMRPGQQDAPLYLGEPSTLPPSAFFMGSLVSPRRPIEASFMITDGYSNNKPYQIFDRDVTFKVLEAVKDAPPIPLYTAEPGQFTGQYQATKTYKFELDGLPKKVVSCLIYTAPVDNQREATLQAFDFDSPGSSVATFPVTKMAPPQTTRVDGSATCADLVAKYVSTQLTLDVRENSLDPAREKANGEGKWLTCQRSAHPYLSCSLDLDPLVRSAVRLLRLGHQPDALVATIALADGVNDEGVVVTRSGQDGQYGQYGQYGAAEYKLPNLDGELYAQLQFSDGTTSDVKVQPISVVPSLMAGTGPPQPGELLKSDSEQAPPVVVVTSSRGTGMWNLGVFVDGDVTKVGWAPDDLAFYPMKKESGIFQAHLDPGTLGLDKAGSARSGPQTIWLRFTSTDGATRTYSYAADFWEMYRQRIRDMYPPQDMLVCGGHSSDDVFSVTCTIKTGLPLAVVVDRVEWGTAPDALQDLDAFDPKAIVEAQPTVEPDASPPMTMEDLIRQEQKLQARQNRLHAMQARLNFTDWHDSVNAFYPGQSILGVTEAVTSLFFRFHYWDGTETDVVRVSVSQ